MPRVICGKCSRELEYSGGDRPSFCAFCGQSLGPSTSLEATAGWSPAPGSSGRGEATVDFVPRAGVVDRSEVPERVKGYRLIRQLGRGGMGTVYEAEDTRHGRKVALKIIAPGYVDSAGAVERFRQEGRLASTLAHPRCVFVLEADEDDNGRPFIAMELMTGDTLQDLVEKGGPLAIGDAVAKILDVIEGLTEAHRLGLIHRDVKPSNCFLDGDGRVKVGDFGLSKSQVGESHLTRTGSFLGTPLYASPEQIKVEPLDARTDVYSTAATLFFLLTGRAPFDRGDASATMARIVTDPAPSAREKRPEVPVGLDRAIRKGLDRDLDRRFATIAQFRDALRAFAPGHVPKANAAVRVGAYLSDSFAVTASSVVLGDILLNLSPWGNVAFNFLFVLAYFALGDGLFGGSPGKRLLRMRVADAGGREAAGLARASLRALVFLALADLPIEGFLYLGEIWPASVGVFVLACFAAEVAGIAVLTLPMWGSEELRGLHDRLTGTRVVAMPRGDRRRGADARRAIGRDRGSVTRPVGVVKAIGPYKVRGAVRWEPDRRVLSGEDSTLGREAWIVIRPKGSPAPDPARREVARATRPRWLDGGEQVEGRWDAYVAPAGCPIADLAGPEGLPWHDARPILEDLADELTAACAEGTLPPGLTVDQVWVQPDGRAVLVDPLAATTSGTIAPGPTDDQRALSLLRRVAAMALEGGRRRLVDEPTAIRAVVPIHASTWLGRLLGGPNAHPTVASSRSDLEATRDLPGEATLAQRATELGVLALFLAIGLGVTFGMNYPMLTGFYDAMLAERAEEIGISMDLVRFRASAFLAMVFPLAWVFWDGVTKGGVSLRFAGLGLIRSDGRKAPRWLCTWRSFLVWSPPVALLIVAALVRMQATSPPLAYWVPFGLAVALMPIYAVLALVLPSCGPHDRLSGLRVVPR